MEKMYRIMSTLSIFLDYDVIPTSLTVAPNSTAIFRCQHHTAIGIGWHVNGTAFIPSNPDITPNTDRDRGGRLVYTLSIVARLIYNYTQIQCVAFFIDMAPELSPVATLIILEGRYYQTITCYGGKYCCIRRNVCTLHLLCSYTNISSTHTSI